MSHETLVEVLYLERHGLERARARVSAGQRGDLFEEMRRDVVRALYMERHDERTSC